MDEHPVARQHFHCAAQGRMMRKGVKGFKVEDLLIHALELGIRIAESCVRSGQAIQRVGAGVEPASSSKDTGDLREQMDEDEMKKILKFYPRTRQADMAAYELLDNKLCGDWQGQEKCPEKESELYEKYASEHPDGPRTAEALYNATYRNAVLVDMFSADGNDNKSNAAKQRTRDVAGRLKDKFPQTDYAARAATLVFRIDQGIPVYGIEHE